jgi:hypothetical protein
VNKEAFDFRYLVDAFGLVDRRSKQQLVDICGERLDVWIHKHAIYKII